MSIRQWPADERPREKLWRHGPTILSDTELIAILLRTGAGRGTSAIDVARQVVASGGGWQGLSTVDLHALCRIRGVGQVKAATVAAAIELARRWATPKKIHAPRLHSSQAFFAAFGPRLTRLTHEQLVVVALNTQYQLLRETTVAIGDVGGAPVHPRAVFQVAIAVSAAAIGVLHNHPSGDARPSAADRDVTDRLAEAGRLIGIPLLDHLIIGDGTYFSFRDAGLIE